MTQINAVLVPQRTDNGGQLKRQAINAGVTGAVLYGTSKVAANICSTTSRVAYSSNKFLMRNPSRTGRMYEKIAKGFIKLGEKIFPTSSKLGRTLENFARKEFGDSKDLAKAIKHYKGNAVVAAIAIPMMLLTAAAGIFKAGKIAGDK